MNPIVALLYKYRYSLAIIALCIVAAAVFGLIIESGHLWIAFIAAAVIYMPGAFYLDRLRIAAEARATKQDLC